MSQLFEAVLKQYELVPPVEPFALSAAGLNNLTWGLQTGAGRLVLKQYQSAQGPAVWSYEHRLLGWLAEQRLSFAVAAPRLTKDGQTLGRTPAGYVALFPLLPGQPPDRDDPAQIEAVGAALGELHAALSRYPAPAHPNLITYGEVDRIHPQVGQPGDLTPARLGWPGTATETALCAWWRAELGRLDHFLGQDYPRLPRQIVHGDYGPGNTLLRKGRISAVLDFEFAGPDVRAIDLAAGLKFSMRVWQNRSPWMVGAAFCRGYRQHGRLTEAEVEAMGSLMILRDVVSTIWWLGRSLDQGRPPSLERIRELRQFTTWLKAHVGQLRGMVNQLI